MQSLLGLLERLLHGSHCPVRHLQESESVLIFLSDGYFLSRNCLREVQQAKRDNKDIILVHETDPSKGGAPLNELKASCPQELQPFVFSIDGVKRPVIPWLRLPAFQDTSLVTIAEQVYRMSMELRPSTPSPRSQLRPDLGLFMPSSKLMHEWSLNEAPRVILYVSTNNIGAIRIARGLLRVRYPEIALTSCLPTKKHEHTLPKLRYSSTSFQETHSTTPRRNDGIVGIQHDDIVVTQHDNRLLEASLRINRCVRRWKGRLRTRLQPNFALLYLNIETFTKNSAELEGELQQLLDVKVPVVMIHERRQEYGACEFSRFFALCDRVVAKNLFSDLAIPLLDGPHKAVSLALVAEKLGGYPEKALTKRSRWLLWQRSLVDIQKKPKPLRTVSMRKITKPLPEQR